MFRNTVAGVLLVATLAASALTQATYVRAASKFDGAWTLVVYTRAGPCDQSYRFSGQISNGIIEYSGVVNLSGRVTPNGAAYARVTGGSNYAVASGHMTARRGTGTWRGQAPNGFCSGYWVATRSW
jgi:hypothetical protein